MKSVFILNFLFLFFLWVKLCVFYLKGYVKTVCEIVNFGLTNWTKKKNLETQHNGITFSYYFYNFVIYYFES